MAKLTAAQRKNIPTSQFGLPSKRKAGSAGKGAYPMPDKAHARDAKAMASRFASPSEKATIDAKANKILGEKKGARKTTKKYTEKSDDKYDKKHGIAKGSKKDMALDKKRGLPEKPTIVIALKPKKIKNPSAYK